MEKYSVFLTVGTQLPFDRLVIAAEAALAGLDADIQATYQVCAGGYRPAGGTVHESVSRADYARLLADCDLFITHAGIGGIVSAVSEGKPIIIMPRLAKYGEHRNDHQLATVSAVKADMMVAGDEADLARLIECAFKERSRFTRSRGGGDAGFLERLVSFL